MVIVSDSGFSLFIFYDRWNSIARLVNCNQVARLDMMLLDSYHPTIGVGTEIASCRLKALLSLSKMKIWIFYSTAFDENSTSRQIVCKSQRSSFTPDIMNWPLYRLEFGNKIFFHEKFAFEIVSSTFARWPSGAVRLSVAVCQPASQLNWKWKIHFLE